MKAHTFTFQAFYLNLAPVSWAFLLVLTILFVNSKFTVLWKNKKEVRWILGALFAFRRYLFLHWNVGFFIFFKVSTTWIYAKLIKIHSSYPSSISLRMKSSYELRAGKQQQRKTFLWVYFFLLLFLSARKNLLLFILSTMHFPSFWEQASNGAPSSSTTSSASGALLLLERPNK